MCAIITFQFLRERWPSWRHPNMIDAFLARFYENERYKVFFRGCARQVLFSFTVTGDPPRRYGQCTVVWSMSFWPNFVKVKGIWSHVLYVLIQMVSCSRLTLDKTSCDWNVSRGGWTTRSRFSWQAVMAKTHFVVIPNVDYCQTEVWFLVDVVLGLLCWGAACIRREQT